MGNGRHFHSQGIQRAGLAGDLGNDPRLLVEDARRTAIKRCSARKQTPLNRQRLFT